MIDLHLHTTASDGHCDPATLVRRAWLAGLRTIAVTDHDTVAAVAETARVAAEYRMRLVTGIEITAVLDGSDVHVLGYFIDPSSLVLGRFLDRQRADRIARAQEMARQLAALGKPIDVERVLAPLATRPDWAVGRPAIAQALVAAGHVPDVAAAFSTLIGDRQPAYVPRIGSTPGEVVRLIAEAGGVASLAHPALIGCDHHIPSWAGDGLGAIEAYHSDHAAPEVSRYLGMARQLGLAVSGGSDFHGDPRHSREMLGRVTLPLTEFDRLEARAGAHRG